MEKKALMVNVSKGVLRGVILTTVCLVIYSIIMNFVDISPKTTSVVYMVITSLSILLGSVYSSKINGEKGWIVGLLVALIYMALLMIVTALVNGGLVFTTLILVQLILALLVGFFSGMLGINL
ncbi:TIGR04086 family membrane protein [Clostridium hydrogeniformans]|uniref:TIGR04086 family membrane protein n=1 Tax=Clostridium hydrogeniformans TaxID=349933 RepID=UPI0004865BC3|nr:TIGR04086 family membrane protein [Clostridium hydrogeniformans]